MFDFLAHTLYYTHNGDASTQGYIYRPFACLYANAYNQHKRVRYKYYNAVLHHMLEFGLCCLWTSVPYSVNSVGDTLRDLCVTSLFGLRDELLAPGGRESWIRAWSQSYVWSTRGGAGGMVMHYKGWEKRGNGETAAGITEAHKVRGFFNFFFSIGQFLFRWWLWYGGFRGTWWRLKRLGKGRG